MESHYGFGTTISEPYKQVVARVKEALGAEGFGVLTEIDVRQTLREKLDLEVPPYLILGACNPHLAHRALELEPQIGLLLPCNVVVRAVDDECRVEVADPGVLLGVVGDERLGVIAQEAKQRLQRALAALRG